MDKQPFDMDPGEWQWAYTGREGGRIYIMTPAGMVSLPVIRIVNGGRIVLGDSKARHLGNFPPV